MNKEQKAAVIEEVAAQIEESEAVFAVDYRGITVAQVADLRVEAERRGRPLPRGQEHAHRDRGRQGRRGRRSRRCSRARRPSRSSAPDGDVALAAKALAQFKREHDVLELQGRR